LAREAREPRQHVVVACEPDRNAMPPQAAHHRERPVRPAQHQRAATILRKWLVGWPGFVERRDARRRLDKMIVVNRRGGRRIEEGVAAIGRHRGPRLARRHHRAAATTARASAGAAYPVPATKRISGPKLAPALDPTKCRPGTDDSNPAESTGEPSTRSTRGSNSGASTRCLEM